MTVLEKYLEPSLVYKCFPLRHCAPGETSHAFHLGGREKSSVKSDDPVIVTPVPIEELGELDKTFFHSLGKVYRVSENYSLFSTRYHKHHDNRRSKDEEFFKHYPGDIMYRSESSDYRDSIRDAKTRLRERGYKADLAIVANMIGMYNRDRSGMSVWGCVTVFTGHIDYILVCDSAELCNLVVADEESDNPRLSVFFRNLDAGIIVRHV